MNNYLLAGVGGQGTVVASKLLAQCAIARGETVHTAETIGMAQRGGCVVSHVRIGGTASPLIPAHCADTILGFEPAEAVRTLQFLRPGGAMVVSPIAVKPVTDALAAVSYDGAAMIEFLKAQDIQLVVPDMARVIEECGTAKVLNVALLAVAAREKVIDFSLEELAEAVRVSLNPKFLDLNLRAIQVAAE